MIDPWNIGYVRPTCSSSRISISSQLNPSGNLYGSCLNSSMGLFSSTGPLFAESVLLPMLGTGCVCQNFHSCLDAASSSDLGALRLLLPTLACSAIDICLSRFLIASAEVAYAQPYEIRRAFQATRDVHCCSRCWMDRYRREYQWLRTRQPRAVALVCCSTS